MIADILIWIAIIIAIENITEIITTSAIFQKVRETLVNIPFIGDLIFCGYCFSVYPSILGAIIAPGEITGLLIVDIIVKWFTLHRLSNIFHEFVSRYLQRLPFLISLTRVNTEILKEEKNEENE